MKKFVKLYLIVVMLLILIVVFYFWQKTQGGDKLTRQEKKQAMEKILGRNIRQAQNNKSFDRKYQGKYFSLYYPENSKINDDKNPNLPKNSLELFSFQTKNPNIFFAGQCFDAKVANINTFDDIPAVNFRRSKKDLYKEQTVKIGSQAGIVFIKEQDGAEKTSFFQAKSVYCSFAVTGTQSLEQIEDFIKETKLSFSEHF